jgi:hypothetical protein
MGSFRMVTRRSMRLIVGDPLRFVFGVERRTVLVPFKSAAPRKPLAPAVNTF